MLTMPAFRGLHPTTQALQQPLSSSGQACGSNYSTLLHKKHENHSIMTAVLTDLLFFDNKKKRINHYDLLLAFTVEPSTNHSRDSSLLRQL